MTIIDIQKRLKDYPALDIELLIANAINRPKEFLYAHPEYCLTLKEIAQFWYKFYSYKNRYSIAAITKHKEFYGLDFYVNKHVLIPRPETELMVAEAIDEIKKSTNTNITFIDIGTGSGCIPIAILKSLESGPIQSFAIDISRRALRVARKNIKTHNVNINLLRGNLLKPLLKNDRLQDSLPTHKANKLIITANLPYLTKSQFKNEPSIQREPKKALVAKKGGLALYEKLFTQVTLLPQNSAKFLLLEIDPSQTVKIFALIKQMLPAATIQTKKDLAGLDRLVMLSIP